MPQGHYVREEGSWDKQQLDGSECPKCGAELKIITRWEGHMARVIGSECSKKCGFWEAEESDGADD